jgi:hypothetical protein
MSPYPLFDWLASSLHDFSIEIRIHKKNGENMLLGNEKTAIFGGLEGRNIWF